MSRQRDEHGRFLPQNAAATMHALTATNLPPEFAHVQQEIDAFIAGSLSDEGDATDIPTRRRAQLKYRALLHRHILTMHTALIVKGYFDAHGRLRAAWLQRLEGLINTARGLDKELGLGRRAKRIPTVQEWIEAQRSDGGVQ